MNKIVVKHSRIEINNYDIGDAIGLERWFSIYDPLTHSCRAKAIEYDEDNRKLIIPRGIDIPYVENIFCTNAYIDTVCDPYVDTDKIRIKYLTKDERQKSILKFILGVGEYAYTYTKSQISVNSTTGSGKTFVTVASICISGYRTMIITSNLEWLKQWSDRIKEYTELEDDDIYLISGSVSISKILRDDPLRYKIFLISHSTINSYGASNGWDKVSELFRYLRCGFKVYDEAHLYFDNISKIDFHTNTRKTLYLTATPERSDMQENKIYQLYFKNIPSISLFDEINDPHVNYLAIHFNSNLSADVISKCKGPYGFSRLFYTDHVVYSTNFLKLVDILIDMSIHIDGKILIYIGTNNAINVVVNYIINKFPFMSNMIGIYTSAVDKSIREDNLYKKYIFSTTKSAGAASDIYQLAMVINLAEPFKSPVLAKQSLGRCRDDNTTYIDIVDNSLYYTKKYYTEKKPIFLKHAKSCRDVYISDEELYEKSDEITNKYSTGTLMVNRIYRRKE